MEIKCQRYTQMSLVQCCTTIIMMLHPDLYNINRVCVLCMLMSVLEKRIQLDGCTVTRTSHAYRYARQTKLEIWQQTMRVKKGEPGIKTHNQHR